MFPFSCLCFVGYKTVFSLSIWASWLFWKTHFCQSATLTMRSWALRDVLVLIASPCSLKVPSCKIIPPPQKKVVIMVMRQPEHGMQYVTDTMVIHVMQKWRRKKQNWSFFRLNSLWMKTLPFLAKHFVWPHLRSIWESTQAKHESNDGLYESLLPHFYWAYGI